MAILFVVVAIVVGAVIALVAGPVPVDPRRVTVGLPALLTAGLTLALVVLAVVLTVDEGWRSWYRTLSPWVRVAVPTLMVALTVFTLLIATALVGTEVTAGLAVLSAVAVLPIPAVLARRGIRQRRADAVLSALAAGGLLAALSAGGVAVADLLGAAVAGTTAAVVFLCVWPIAVVGVERRRRAHSAVTPLRQTARIDPVTVAVLGTVPLGAAVGLWADRTAEWSVVFGIFGWGLTAGVLAWWLARTRRRHRRSDLRVVDRSPGDDQTRLTVENTGPDPADIAAARIEDAAGYHYRLDGDAGLEAGDRCVVTVPDGFCHSRDNTAVGLPFGYRLGRDRTAPLLYSTDGAVHVLDTGRMRRDGSAHAPPVRRT